MADAYLGHLLFKNRETNEKKEVNALASIDPSSGAELSFEFPVGIGSGTWHQFHVESIRNRIEGDAEKWIPLAFRPQDEKFLAEVEAKCQALLDGNPQEAQRMISADRRAKRLKFEDVVKGWRHEALWDPFISLAKNGAELLAAAAQSSAATPATAEEKGSWLGRAVMPAPVETVAPSALPQEAETPAAGSRDAIERQIFCAEALPSFSQVASSAAANLRSNGYSAPELPAETAELAGSESPASAPVAKTGKNISFKIARLPKQWDNGSVVWDDALFSPTSFIPKDAFETIKFFWQGTAMADDSKKLQLYSVEVLQALSGGGYTVDVEGVPPKDRHYSDSDGVKVLDVENFVYSACAASPIPGAQAFAELAKARILSDRIWNATIAAQSEMADSGEGAASSDPEDMLPIDNFLPVSADQPKISWSQAQQMIKIDGAKPVRVKLSAKLAKIVENIAKQLKGISSLPKAAASTTEERTLHGIDPAKIEIRQKREQQRRAQARQAEQPAGGQKGLGVQKKNKGS